MAPSLLPPVLTQRAIAYHKAKVAAEARTEAKVDETRGRHTLVRIESSYNHGEFTYKIGASFPRPPLPDNTSTAMRARIEAARAALDERMIAVVGTARARDREAALDELSPLAQEYAGQMKENLRERDALCREIGEHFRTSDPDKIDAVLENYARAAAEQATADAMTDYRLVLFEPGLSPGRRRLLFDLAAEEFHLPLPPACSNQPNLPPP